MPTLALGGKAGPLVAAVRGMGISSAFGSAWR